MDRRSFFLTLAGGLAATAVVGAVASEAEAKPVAAAPAQDSSLIDAVAKSGTEAETPKDMQYYYYRRPRPYYRPRPRVYYRPVYRRRCWRNRWGRLVCSY